MYCSTSTLFLQALLLELCIAGYVLETSYTAANWFDQFTFFTSGDPSGGYVNYVDRTTATNKGYISTANGVVYMGVDSTSVSGSGRESVRIVSNAAYNYGLFALDVSHMPGGICGTWQALPYISILLGTKTPAFWMVGPNWPYGGEIDIIEGVNDNGNNAMTLHTSDGCSVSNSGAFTGTLTTSNCYIYGQGQYENAGCDIQDQLALSYGAGFNVNRGGVIVLEWTTSDINIWFFPRGSTPPDLVAGTPNPASWVRPVAQFQGACNIPSHFSNMQLVLNTDFCGDWAGAVWSQSPHCSSLASSCTNYVQNNPSAFKNAYWEINSLKIYQSNGGVAAVKHTAVGAAAGLQKNETAPLSSAPLAMGGPPAKKE